MAETVNEVVLFSRGMVSPTIPRASLSQYFCQEFTTHFSIEIHQIKCENTNRDTYIIQFNVLPGTVRQLLE